MLPATRMQHGNHPRIWQMNNLLRIASICEYSNGLEYIDLRDNRKWKVVKNNGGGNRSFDSLFGTKIKTDRCDNVCSFHNTDKIACNDKYSNIKC